MANLGDYIGRILAEVMFARSQADIEALRMAEIYSSHPMLKNFPVPRMRLPKAEINIPLLISEMEEEENERTSFQRDRIYTDTASYLEIIEKELNKYSITLSEAEATKLRDALRKRSDEIEYLRDQAISMITIATELATEAVETLVTYPSFKDTVQSEEIKKIQRSIESKLRDKFIKERKRPPRIGVLPLTDQVREIDNTEHIVTMKLSLVEDALEWNLIDDNGEEKVVLTSE